MTEQEIKSLDDDENTELVLSLHEVGGSGGLGKAVFSIPVDRDVAMQSNLIKGFLEQDPDQMVIPLSMGEKGVASPEVLQEIVRWMQYHHKNPMKEIPRPMGTINVKLAKYVGDWDAEFIHRSVGDVSRILKAAAYLDLQPLMNLSAARLAAIIKNEPTMEGLKARFDNPETPPEPLE